MGSFSCARKVLVAAATPVLVFSLAACGGQDDAQQAASASAEASSSASPSPTATTASPTPEPTTEAPSPEETEEPSEEPTPEQTQPILEADAEKLQLMYASEEELAQILAAQNQAIRDKGRDPDDEYVKYGEVLCHGAAFPSSDELREVGASDAFVDWYARYVEEAPQHVRDMSSANRAVEEQGAEAPAVDQEKCSEYGLL